MKARKSLLKWLKEITKDHNFLYFLENIEGIVSKILSMMMIIVIVVAIFQLGLSLIEMLFTTKGEPFTNTLFKIFGLFLNILIALEILENITAYLKKHVIQVELVIVTSLIAVARKIIILDLEKTSGVDIIGLAVAILSLGISYWIIRSTNAKSNE